MHLSWTAQTRVAATGVSSTRTECSMCLYYIYLFALDSYYAGCFQNDSTSNVPLSGYVRLTESKMAACACQQACKLELYSYSASHNGSGCFCGNWLPSVRVEDSKCDIVCLENDVEVCGGSEYSSVFETSVFAVRLSGLDVLIQYETAVFSGYVVQNGPTNETTFHWDFGDGTCLILFNVPVVVHQYMLPGNYTMHLTAVGAGQSEAVDEMLVSVLAQPKLSLLFDDIYNSHDHGVPGQATLLQGTMVTVTWSTTHHNESIFHIGKQASII